MMKFYKLTDNLFVRPESVAAIGLSQDASMSAVIIDLVGGQTLRLRCPSMQDAVSACARIAAEISSFEAGRGN